MSMWPISVAFFFLLIWDGANGELVEYGSPADDFVKSLLVLHTGTETCRDEFDTRFLLKFDYADGKHRKWEEPDRREPGVTNHTMEWTFPGYRLVAYTYFAFYGPSTWLHQLELSAPSDLPMDLQFGDSVERFAEILSLPAGAASTGMVTDHAYVSFVIGDDNTVQSIILECVAD